MRVLVAVTACSFHTVCKNSAPAVGLCEINMLVGAEVRCECPRWVESGLTRTEHQGEQEVRQPVKITVQRCNRPR